MSAAVITRPTTTQLVVPMIPAAGGFLRPLAVTEVQRPTLRQSSPADFSCGDYLKYLEIDA